MGYVFAIVDRVDGDCCIWTKDTKETKKIKEMVTNLWKEILNRLPPRYFPASNVTEAAGATTTTTTTGSEITILQQPSTEIHSSPETTSPTGASSSIETFSSISINYESTIISTEISDQTSAPSISIDSLDLSSSISTSVSLSTPVTLSSISSKFSSSTISAWTTTTTNMKVATPEIAIPDTSTWGLASAAPTNGGSDPISQAGTSHQRPGHGSDGPRFSEPPFTHEGDSTPGFTPGVLPGGDPDPQIGTIVFTNTDPDTPPALPTYYCPPSGNPADCRPGLSVTITLNQTGGYWPSNNTAPPTTSSASCVNVEDGEPVTEYSIIYTETVTFYGNSSDYTPPYQPIETPNYCGTSIGAHPSSFESTEGERTFSKHETSKITATPCGDSCEFSAPGYQYPTTQTIPPNYPTVTFVTTDKNPSVVYPTKPPPRYSKPSKGSGPGGNRAPGEHITVPPNEQGDGRNGGASGQGFEPQGVGAPPRIYTVTAMGEQVIINDQTFSNLEPSQTSIVTVGDGVFTILPTAVVGEGATVGKPQPVDTVTPAITPQSTVVGKVPVVVSGSEAVIDGSTFTIPPAGTTAIVNGEPVSIGAGTIVVHDQTFTFQPSRPQYTDVIVQGGEMITAAGQSIYVFHQTTLTYGSGISETTEVIDDDTITIGPSGVTIHGKTMGGPSALPSKTAYEIVGGATITRLSPSFVAIDGTTFTVGPGATTTTKVIGGETITIGPSGVSIASMTLSYPFGPTSVVTIKPSVTKGASVPTKTNTSNKDSNGKGDDSNDDGQNDSKDDDSIGVSLRPNSMGGILGSCIAIGVWVLI